MAGTQWLWAILAFLLQTITLMAVFEGACRLVERSERVRNNIMTIEEWIKSMIRSDKYSARCKKRYCRRYISAKRKGKTTRIGRKKPRWKQLDIIKAFTAERDKEKQGPEPDIRHKPQSFRPDSDSFLIGIDNHASFTISNNSHHFVGPITPLKGPRTWPTSPPKSYPNQWR